MFIIVILVIVSIISFFVVRAYIVVGPQVENYKAYWDQRATELPNAPRRYIALGDSAAQSVGASDPELGYVGLIASEINVGLDQDLQVINLSKSGARLQDVIDTQLPALKNLEPSQDDVITIEIGANDMGSYSESSFREDMNSIMSQLPPQTVISTMPYFGGGIKRGNESNAFRASAQVRELAKEYDLRVAELYEITRKNDSWRNYAADFFHPSDRAYKFWAQSFMVHVRSDITQSL